MPFTHCTAFTLPNLPPSFNEGAMWRTCMIGYYFHSVYSIRHTSGISFHTLASMSHMVNNMILFLNFLNPENVIHYGGLALLLVIIFAETGLFFGFFLPGDSLLFVAGLFSGTEYFDVHLSLLIPALILVAVAGSTTGYFTGRWAGRYLRNKNESLIFKKSYIDMTSDFYERHGMMTFILGRFLPIIRTFVTILAGMARLNFPKFLLFNIMGATIWVVVMVLSGYWLGNMFPEVTDYMEIIIGGMVMVSAVPVILTLTRHRPNRSKQEVR